MKPSGTTTMPARLAAGEYDGRTPFAVSGRTPGTVQGWTQVGVTIAFVVVPFAGLAAAVWLAWGHGLNLADVLLALAFYVITGLGVTVGFHRLLTHRSFTAVPALRVALAIAGSMTTAATTPPTAGPVARIPPTGTAAAWPGSSAAARTPTRAGCCATTRPRPRGTPRTWWPIRPCGPSRPRSPPCARSPWPCRSRRGG